LNKAVFQKFILIAGFCKRPMNTFYSSAVFSLQVFSTLKENKRGYFCRFLVYYICESVIFRVGKVGQT